MLSKIWFEDRLCRVEFLLLHFNTWINALTPSLQGEKKTWISGYRNLKKVKKFLYNKNPGQQVHQISLGATSIFRPGPNSNDQPPRSMICNLLQNPHSRPIVSSWQPALLRQGVMWLLLEDSVVPFSPTSSKKVPNPRPKIGMEERWLLTKATHLILLKYLYADAVCFLCFQVKFSFFFVMARLG